MMGQLPADQSALFYDFCLDDYIPQGHFLRQIDRILDLSELRKHLAPFYSDNGLGVMSLPQAEGESHSHNHEELENGQNQTEIQDQSNSEQLGNKNINHTTGNHDDHQH